MQALTVYFITNIFLFIMGGYLFIKTTSDLMTKRENTLFRVFIIAFGYYLIMNSLWTLQEADLIQTPKWLFEIICMLSLSGVVLCMYCFYKFLMIYFGYSKERFNIYQLLGMLPFLAMLLLLVISIWNGFVFSVSDDLKIVHGNGYIILPIYALIYFGIIIVSSIIRLKKSKSPQAKKNSLTIFLLTIFLMGWIFVDNLIDSFTIIPMAIFSVILGIFISLQQAGINTDALTQMNNRRKAMEYLTNQLDNVSEDAPLYIYICDINHFKEINDTFGHLEGDKAIIIFAESIKEAMQTSNGFAARYGGDEFIIAVKPSKDKFDENEIIEKINNIAELKCVYNNKPYNVTITAGYAKCTNKQTSAEAYLREADNYLYENKENRKYVSPIKDL